jgi:hypothetical protein
MTQVATTNYCAAVFDLCLGDQHGILFEFLVCGFCPTTTTNTKTTNNNNNNKNNSNNSSNTEQGPSDLAQNRSFSRNF